jgi:hypothetical protein
VSSVQVFRVYVGTVCAITCATHKETCDRLQEVEVQVAADRPNIFINCCRVLSAQVQFMHLCYEG